MTALSLIKGLYEKPLLHDIVVCDCFTSHFSDDGGPVSLGPEAPDVVDSVHLLSDLL